MEKHPLSIINEMNLGENWSFEETPVSFFVVVFFIGSQKTRLNLNVQLILQGDLFKCLMTVREEEPVRGEGHSRKAAKTGNIR